jgi:hypothetical protein
MSADYVDDRHERQWGWGICVVCGVDCEEDDYDEDRRSSVCKDCRAEQREQQRLSDEDRLALEVFARR